MPYRKSWGEKAKRRSRTRNEYFKEYNKSRNEEKVIARRMVQIALTKGKMVKGDCEKLSEDCTGRIEAHHEDYSEPLKINWLCSKHHRDADAERIMRLTNIVLHCQCCGIELKLPKRKYCSNYCNLKQWRIDKRHMI